MGNRAKQRLRTSSAAAAAPPADESSKKIELNKTKNSKFNSNIVNNNNSNVNSFAARISDSRRSKSCERKSVSGSRRTAGRREILQSPKPIRSAGKQQSGSFKYITAQYDASLISIPGFIKRQGHCNYLG